MRILLIVSIFLLIVFIMALVYVKNENYIFYKKEKMIFICILINIFMIFLVVLIAKMPRKSGSIITTKIYENIIQINDIDNIICYEKNGVIIREIFYHSIDKENIKENMVIKVITYESTSYEYWILGYKYRKNVVVIE